MAIDRDLLAELRRYVDQEHGVAEEFLTRRFGPKGAIGVLTRALADPLPEAWVICPSLGSEQANLRRLEGLVARTLAGAGVATLRLRHDARRSRALSLSERLSEAEDAVGFLSEELAVARVGAAGALFGGAVAAIVCDRLDLAALALWEPVDRGDRYLRAALRFQRIAGLVEASGGPRPERGETASEELIRRGFTVVRGYRLDREDSRKIQDVDLSRDVRRYCGRSLLVSVSANGQASPAATRCAQHLGALGGDVSLEVVGDSLALPFGEHYYRNVGVRRIDTRLELDRRIAAVTVEWAAQMADIAQASVQ